MYKRQLVEERDPQSLDRVVFHVVDRWRYMAKLPILEDIYDLGYQLLGENNRPSSLVNKATDSRDDADDRFDLDIYFILVRFMVDKEKMKMNNLKIWPLIELSSLA